MFQSTTKDVEISFIYSVKYVKNHDIGWASRWDYIYIRICITRTISIVLNFKFISFCLIVVGHVC